jgi:hypothetical protein
MEVNMNYFNTSSKINSIEYSYFQEASSYSASQEISPYQNVLTQ